VAIYTIKLTIPPNTPPESPERTTVKLRKAILTHMSIRIPPGHHALAGIRVLYGITQLWPEETGTWLTGDDEVLEWEEYFELPTDPTTLVLEGYNEDDTYEHSFYIRLMTLPKAIAAPWLGIVRFVQMFEKLVGMR